MRVTFTMPADGSHPALLAEAELHFDAPADSMLACLKLVGFAVRRTKSGLYATVPGRAFGAGTARAYFDFIRYEELPPDAADADRAVVLDLGRAAMLRLKEWIVAEYLEWEKAGGRLEATAFERRPPAGDPVY